MAGRSGPREQPDQADGAAPARHAVPQHASEPDKAAPHGARPQATPSGAAAGPEQEGSDAGPMPMDDGAEHHPDRIAIPAMPPRRTDAVARIWDVILFLDLAFLAYILIGGAVRALSGVPPPTDINEADVVANTVVGLLLMAGVPLLWAANTRVGGWSAVRDTFVMRFRAIDLLEGVGWTFGILGVVIAIVSIEIAIWGVPAENELLQELQSRISIPTAILIALSAGFGEEILFRGLLMRLMRFSWWGVLVQALFFGIAHAGYGTLTQVTAPFAIGILLGVLVARGRSLWVVIAAHTFWDLAVLLLPRFIGG